MDKQLCPDCRTQLDNDAVRHAAAHPHLRGKAHFPGRRSMYSTNTNETTTYECSVCGAVIVYYGDDKTESALFWVQNGWMDGSAGDSVTSRVLPATCHPG